MIVLDYLIRSAPSADMDLSSVDETDIYYRLFLGDVTFRIDNADLSAMWGWIPIVDFAAGLHRISEALRLDAPQTFEFTESTDHIDFSMQNSGKVEVHASFGGGIASVPIEELRDSSKKFLLRVLDDFIALNPTLSQNATVRRLRGDAKPS